MEGCSVGWPRPSDVAVALNELSRALTFARAVDAPRHSGSYSRFFFARAEQGGDRLYCGMGTRTSVHVGPADVWGGEVARGTWVAGERAAGARGPYLRWWCEAGELVAFRDALRRKRGSRALGDELGLLLRLLRARDKRSVGADAAFSALAADFVGRAELYGECGHDDPLHLDWLEQRLRRR